MNLNPAELWNSFRATVSLFSEEQKKRLVCEMTRRILKLSFDDTSTKPLLTECVETLDQFLAGEISLKKVKEISNQNLEVMHSIDHWKSFCDALTRECYWAANVMIYECCST